MLFLTPNNLSMILCLPEEILWSLSEDLPEPLSEVPLSVKLILRRGDQELILENCFAVGDPQYVLSDRLLTSDGTQKSERHK